MKNIYKILFLFALVSAFLSCEEAFTTTRKIDIPDHEEKLSVFVQAGKNKASVFLSHSKKIDDDTPYKDFIANVTLLEDDVEILNLDYDTQNTSHRRYDTITLDSKIKADKTYTLIVDSEKFGTAKSIQKTTSDVEISDIKVIKDGSEGRGEDLLEFKLKDDKNTENYYFLKVSGKIKNQPYEHYEEFYIKPEKGTESQTIYFDELNGELFSDYSFNGKSKKMFFNLTRSGVKHRYEHLKIEISSITKDNYNFFISKEQSGESGENPFSEPVIVINNIENGYGQFFAFNTKEYIYEFE